MAAGMLCLPVLMVLLCFRCSLVLSRSLCRGDFLASDSVMINSVMINSVTILIWLSVSSSWINQLTAVSSSSSAATGGVGQSSGPF